MATAKSTPAPADSNEIQRRMAQIRRDLHEDVRGVVASAEAVTDWRRYIRNYPWTAMGVALAAGYLVVPRRHRSVPHDLATHADVARVREVVEGTRDKAEGTREKEKEASKERKGLLAMAMALLGPVALRAAQGYAVSYLENWIVQQQAMAAGPPPQGQARAPGGTGRPSGTPGG